MTEGQTVGWHYRLNGREFEQNTGDGEGQGGLACCSPWGHKELDMTEQLNQKNKEFFFIFYHVLLSEFISPKETSKLRKQSLRIDW